MLILNYGIVSLTLNVNPTLFVIPCNIFWGFIDYNVAIIITYQVIFHPNLNHP